MDEKTQKEFGSRVRALLDFAKKKDLEISAVQKLNPETNYIEIVPLFKNIRKEAPKK